MTRRKPGPQPKAVSSLTALAAALVPPRDRKILTRAQRLPGCPGRNSEGLFEVGVWQEFVNKNFESRAGVDGDPTDKRLLELEKLRLTNERLQFELDVRRRDYSLNSDIDKWLGDMLFNFRKALTRAPSKLAPLVVGRTEAEAEELIKIEINEAMQVISSSPWQSR